MFSDDVLLAKVLEQRAISLSLQHVVKEYGSPNDPLSQAIMQLPLNPQPSQVASVIRMLRAVSARQATPLHRDIALSIFVGADLSEALERAVRALPNPKTTADLFGVTRRAACLMGRSLWYYLFHPRQLWSSFTGSSHGVSLVGKWFPFDPKAFGWNASGRVASERFVDETAKELCIDWTVGPTPTVGLSAAPETVLALEGMSDRGSRCFPHGMWIYVNLQSLSHAAEGARSRALLRLSKKYPSTFRVASISVDAPFYRNPHHHGATLEQHRDRLIHEIRSGSWYTFVVNEDERKSWWKCVDGVIEQAYQLARSRRHKIVVFHELVVLGLIRAWQAFCCRTTSGLVMSTVACRECIDRGGSVNAAFAWAFSEDSDEQRARKVMSILWGRPLLAKQRLILASRTKGFEALVASCTPDEVRTYLRTVWTMGSLGRWQN